MHLSELLPGHLGIIKDFDEDLNIRRRLQDLGFVCGAQVECLYSSPLKDPTAYQICGTVIALRRKDADQIYISEVTK